jgi:hypothetical protein
MLSWEAGCREALTLDCYWQSFPTACLLLPILSERKVWYGQSESRLDPFRVGYAPLPFRPLPPWQWCMLFVVLTHRFHTAVFAFAHAVDTVSHRDTVDPSLEPEAPWRGSRLLLPSQCSSQNLLGSRLPFGSFRCAALHSIRP